MKTNKKIHYKIQNKTKQISHFIQSFIQKISGKKKKINTENPQKLKFNEKKETKKIQFYKAYIFNLIYRIYYRFI